MVFVVTLDRVVIVLFVCIVLAFDMFMFLHFQGHI